MQTTAETGRKDPDSDLRDMALRRLEKKREFRGHLLAYVMVHALLWAIWGVVFYFSGSWFPWPLIPMFGWGIGLAFHAWEAYGRFPFTEDDIQRELARRERH